VGSTESFLSKAFEKLKDIQVGFFVFFSPTWYRERELITYEVERNAPKFVGIVRY
jgi:hypothetical protein